MSMSEVILNELTAACHEQPEWSALLPQINDVNCGVHLAILQQPYLGYVLDGTKTVESRFAVSKAQPFGRVAVGDLIFLKQGPVVGAFTAASAEFINLTDPSSILQIYEHHAAAICAPHEFWFDQMHKRYATLIGVSNVISLPPVKVTKRDMRGWVVLRNSQQPQLPVS